jgi:hypothetical protein
VSVGKPVKPANVESLALRNKQIDEIEVSFAVFKQLRQLDLSQNRLRFVRQLENALSAPVLEELDLTANPIAKELADFRLYIIAHTANTLLLLNGEPVSELERCRAWLAFPDCDPIKNKALQASLARPITDEVLQAYAAAGRAIVDEHAASAAALVEKELAAEREAVERRAQVLADRESIEQERKAEAARRAAALAEHERLLAEAREADRKTAIDSGLIAPAPATPSVAAVSAAATAAALKSAAPAVAVAVATPSIDDIFGNSAVAAAVPKAGTPTPSAAGSAGGLWWTDAPIGGVLSAVEGVDDAPLDLASVAERARVRAAERPQQEAATLAKLQAIQAAKEESERVASLASDEARRERELAAMAEKARQEALAREQIAKEDSKRREAAELATRRAHEEQERARAEQRRREEEAAQRERERVAKERADAEREKAARAAHEATERMRREAEESRLRETAAAAAAVTSSGTIFEESPDELRKAVERQERQLEALRNAGAHLVALDKAEEKLEKARRRLAAGGSTAVAPGESPTAPVRVIKSLDTRLSVATATGKAASIFDDVLDDAATRKSKAAAAKTKSAMDDLFGAI